MSCETSAGMNDFANNFTFNVNIIKRTKKISSNDLRLHSITFCSVVFVRLVTEAGYTASCLIHSAQPVKHDRDETLRRMKIIFK